VFSSNSALGVPGCQPLRLFSSVAFAVRILANAVCSLAARACVAISSGACIPFAAIKGIAAILILAPAVVMVEYGVETGTSALRGKLAEVSLSAVCAIADKVYQAHRTVQHAPGQYSVLSCSSGLQPADGTFVRDFGGLVYIGVV
jgi:hypothetical protein